MGSHTILLRSGLAALVLLSSPLPAGCSLEAEATVRLALKQPTGERELYGDDVPVEVSVANFAVPEVGGRLARSLNATVVAHAQLLKHKYHETLAAEWASVHHCRRAVGCAAKKLHVAGGADVARWLSGEPSCPPSRS